MKKSGLLGRICLKPIIPDNGRHDKSSSLKCGSACLSGMLTSAPEQLATRLLCTTARTDVHRMLPSPFAEVVGREILYLKARPSPRHVTFPRIATLLVSHLTFLTDGRNDLTIIHLVCVELEIAPHLLK